MIKRSAWNLKSVCWSCHLTRLNKSSDVRRRGVCSASTAYRAEQSTLLDFSKLLADDRSAPNRFSRARERPARTHFGDGRPGRSYNVKPFPLRNALPEHSLPYERFIDMLKRRLDYLGTGSRFRQSISEMCLQAKEDTIKKSFAHTLLSQSASHYRKKDPRLSKPPSDDNFGIPSLNELRRSFESGGLSKLDDLLVRQFGLFASMSLLSKDDLERQKRLADMRYPAEWYPLARSVPRKLHLHVGPTNSGKTYQALKRLEDAQSGCFAGPLRLLAFEIYDRLNKKGIPCNLLTGEERRFEEGVQLTSSTIEMLDVGSDMDVLVIDEIQMIADEDRGWAWTHALLGSAAKEIHMCGEASAVPIIKSIVESLGEEVEIHEYQRLSALQAMDNSLGGTFKAVESGDAIVTFSRKNIFNIKENVEQITGMKCAVVYGGLPPETRAAQARLFNDPDSGFDVIVASDAIGMGLNLSIKRVIFETLEKFDGREVVTIPIPQIKQIAGRAGRFKLKIPAVGPTLPKDAPGYVTTLRENDLPTLHEALAHPTIELKKVVLKPTVEIVEAFVRPYPKDVRLSVVLSQLLQFAQVRDLYSLKAFQTDTEVLDLLHSVQNLSFGDRWTLCGTPISTRDNQCVKAFLEMARKLGEGSKADLLDLEEVHIDLLDGGIPKSNEALAKLESLHKILTMYLWLSLRFPATYASTIEVYQLKEACEEMIAEALEQMKTKKISRREQELPFRSSSQMFNFGNRPFPRPVFPRERRQEDTKPHAESRKQHDRFVADDRPKRDARKSNHIDRLRQ